MGTNMVADPAPDVLGSWPQRIDKPPRGEPNDGKLGLKAGLVSEELTWRSLRIGKGRYHAPEVWIWEREGKVGVIAMDLSRLGQGVSRDIDARVHKREHWLAWG